VYPRQSDSTAPLHCVEFVGTFMFLLMAYGATIVASTKSTLATVDDSRSTTGTVLFFGFAYGVPLMMNIWASSGRAAAI
jgi:glycerol uptake facilitator-like aquaporin